MLLKVFQEAKGQWAVQKREKAKLQPFHLICQNDTEPPPQADYLNLSAKSH